MCGSGDVKAKGLVEGVQAGCFPQLYQFALGSNPLTQVITRINMIDNKLPVTVLKE